MAGLFKVNFDGAIFQEEKAFGVGIVIRDEFRQFVAATSKKLQVTGTPQHVLNAHSCLLFF